MTFATFRATPEQWDLIAETGGGCMSATILELRARVEALEAAQLEQAESHRFCTDAIVRRVEALEAAQHAHADLSRLSDAERDRMAQELAKPAAWRPLETETTYGTEAFTATAQQILRAPMVVEGTFEHGGETYRFKAKPEREAPMAELRAASAEARPAGGLVERVAQSIAHKGCFAPEEFYDQEARAAIREVAKWLRAGRMLHAAELLEQEADRG
jgi:hypothetical protein